MVDMLISKNMLMNSAIEKKRYVGGIIFWMGSQSILGLMHVHIHTWGNLVKAIHLIALYASGKWE